MEAIPLNKIFDKKNNGIKLNVSVKVIKSNKETEFLVADSSGSCTIKTTNLKPIFIANLKEKNFVRILNVKVNLTDKLIILDSTTSVFRSSSFEIIEGLEGDADDKILPKPIPTKDFQSMSRQRVSVPLNEVFEMKNWSKRFKITVKVLKAIGEKEFLVADSTSSCKIKIANLKSIYMANLDKDNFVKILDAKVDVVAKFVIVDYKSSVFNITRFENVKDPSNAQPIEESQKNLQYKIPKMVFEEFMNRANLKNVQTLGFLVGYKSDNIITVTDIVFGKQNANKYKVNDNGK